ncbi:unnamed protein product [Pleuronectes platessa]|uniref:ERI1 exoribonuclease 2 n=1 Tax=Pleuronectes platessa TaxID=8262 RepID=A0A9N7UDU4_PLEPL|nr:unnamed protein product [Pleuronectes platessa]
MSTRKLAKQLGLLRQRSQSSSGSKKALLSNQTFSYLIVIDFESTCWREKSSYSPEVIEFPAVLLNTSSGEVESEFHTYVQPQEHPTLSEFCTELTGITQIQVEAGIPLRICLSRFCRWLQTLQLEKGVVFPNKQQNSSPPPASPKLCTFLTWSDWDLGVCLQYECKRKQLHKPDVLNSWIDLRSTYRLFYDRKPKGLNGALQDLGIQFAGREHSGLDDSRNTAQLAARMMRDGCVMKITRSLERTPSTVKPVFGKTLLNGTNTPLWGCGRRSVTSGAVADRSSSVTINMSSLHSNGNNTLLLCSTTLGCLSDLPHTDQPFKSGGAVAPVEDEEGGELSVETEERHKALIPGKTSTPNASFVKPKQVIMQNRNHKTPRTSFTIFTDLVQQAAASHPSSCSSLFTPKNVLGSLSANTNSSSTNRSSMSVTLKKGQQITSPLCGCGRRAKRQLVSNGGPNHGRGFYCCPVRRSGSGGRVQKGCEFFKWESSLMNRSSVASPAARASISICSTLNRQPQQSTTIRKSY